MRALRTPSAVDRLSAEDRDTLRETADTIVLAPDCTAEARMALAAARAVLLSIQRDEVEPWIEQLADDLEDAGPWLVDRLAMCPPVPDGQFVTREGQPARR